MGRLVAILALSIGCGRIGFRPVQTSGSDAAIGDGIGVDVPIVNGGTRITDDPGSSRCPSVAVHASDFGVAWVDDRDGNDEIYFVRLDQTGARIDLVDRRLTMTAAPSGCPCLVGNATGWAVIWPEGVSGSEDLFLLLLAADGTPSGAAVQVTNDSAGSTAPALAFDGTNYGLAWESHGGNGASIEYASLSAAGAVQQTATLANTGADNRGPAVAWTGAIYGVAWGNDTGPGEDVMYVPVTPPATAGTAVEVSPLFFATKSVLALAWSGSELGTVWRDYNQQGNDDLYFTGLTGTGTATGPIQDLGIAGYDIYDAHQHIIATAAGYAFTWAVGEVEVFFRTVDTTVGPRIVISSGSASAPSIALDGTAIGIAWQDQRDGNNEIYFDVR